MGVRPQACDRDALGCLKRYLARELYNDIQAIVATTQPRSDIEFTCQGLGDVTDRIRQVINQDLSSESGWST